MKRLFTIVTLALVALAGLGGPTVASGQARERCFPETGYCVAGEILAYWEHNGGLPVFGYPIGPENPNEIVEGSWVGRTQWFERDRLEVHAEGVLAGRMGARLLELQGRSWWDFPPYAGGVPDGCVYFSETRHSLCEPFLSYWRAHGLELDGRRGKTAAESLALFGAPISEPQLETLGDGQQYVVQWFERARFENHGGQGVLLGLLANELASARGWRR